MCADSTPVLRFEGVEVWVPQDGERLVLLSGIDWDVRRGERWALLGRNGAGKSTLLSLAGARRHPSAGTVQVMGRRLGRVDVRELRALVGAVTADLRIPERLTVEEYVLTGATGTVQPLPGRLTRDDHKRAAEVVELFGLGPIVRRDIAVCSQGQRAKARIARALMPDPHLLLLDEATSALDLPSREDLLVSLDILAAEIPSLAMVTVTHHVEELPGTTSHAMLLREGRIVAAGPIGRTLTGPRMSQAYDLELEVQSHDGRWSARKPFRRSGVGSDRSRRTSPGRTPLASDGTRCS